MSATPARPSDRSSAHELGEAIVAADAGLERPGVRGFESHRRDSGRRRLLALADALGLAVATGGVWAVAPPVSPVRTLVGVAVAIPLWILLHKMLGLYDRDANLIHKSTLDDLPRVVLGLTVGVGLGALIAPSLGFEVERGPALGFLAVALLAVPALRAAVRSFVVRRYAAERCLIVGSGSVAGLIARKLAVHPEYGVDLVGFVDASDPEGPFETGDHADHIGDLERFDELCREYCVERVVIAFSSISHEKLIEVIRKSKELDLKITVVPRLFEVIGHSVEVDQLEGMTLLGLRGLSRTRSSLGLKRAIDVAGGAFGLLLLLPLLLLVALAVKLTSRGPVLYAQERIGRGNQRFRILKFRTMEVGADALKRELAHLNEAEGPMFKIAEDPRITTVGRFLRRTSIDELPQLINVVRGQMSLVGPRPLVPDEDEAVIGYHRERLDLTPGLTGPWQVLGRTAIPFEEMVKLDYLYVAEWSLWNDLKLLLRTLPVVVGRSGH